MDLSPGTLYMVATPIGNLEDLTFRALEVLRKADAAYAEDTRVTGILFKRYGIETPLFSYREAAERLRVERDLQRIFALLKEGKAVAYVSDAGTPGLSDPGAYLAARTVQEGYPVSPVPGPSALAALISASGVTASGSLFVGFLPKKKGRQTRLVLLREALAGGLCHSLVFYESPERILRLLADLVEWRLPLYVFLGRELTKLHEEILRGRVEDVLADLARRPAIKGEIALGVSLLRSLEPESEDLT